jgi:hypothetical protein
MAMMTNLVGMFLVLDTTDHEYYRTGEIVAAVGRAPSTFAVENEGWHVLIFAARSRH